MPNTPFRITSAVLLSLLASCGLFSADSAGLDYLPLSLGNTWVYQSEYEQRGSPVEHKVVVEERLAMDRKNYFVLSSVTENFGANPIEHSDTIRVVHNIVSKRSGNREVVWFNFNARDGATYEYINGYTVKVKKGLTVEAHGREFSDCIRFYFDIPRIADEEFYYFFAKGVGIVRMGGAWSNVKLASYKLEK